MDLLDQTPLPKLATRLIFEAMVDIAAREDMGTGPLGNRGIVPILGGAFRGGPDFPGLHGRVEAGGADRQQMRPDGVKELDAFYEIRVHDGTLLTVRNRVLIDEANTGPRPGGRYALSVIRVTAPEGPWAFLNRRVIMGTLQSARPARAAVIIRAWEADAFLPG